MAKIEYYFTKIKSLKKTGVIAFALGLVAVLSVLTIGIIIAAPGITNVDPDRGTSLGGTPITIYGSGFSDFSAATPINFNYTGACVPHTISQTGTYRLETWGASGGNAGTYAGGRGGYAVGYVRLTQGTIIHVCVGGAGQQAARLNNASFPGGFNGGRGAVRGDNGNGKETASGGGATDIRIGINSLYARAIVAGGGGGGVGYNTTPLNVGMIGGFGGGLSGGAATGYNPGSGATQIAGGTIAICTGSGFFWRSWISLQLWTR
jgi:hypothetical protein